MNDTGRAHRERGEKAREKSKVKEGPTPDKPPSVVDERRRVHQAYGVRSTYSLKYCGFRQEQGVKTTVIVYERLFYSFI